MDSLLLTIESAEVGYYKAGGFCDLVSGFVVDLGCSVDLPIDAAEAWFALSCQGPSRTLTYLVEISLGHMSL
jgi:hypothetical protein